MKKPEKAKPEPLQEIVELLRELVRLQHIRAQYETGQTIELKQK